MVILTMKIEFDLHIHTISSGHAYSTLTENVQAAKEKGLKMTALTDHGPAMPGAGHPFHFYNLRILPEYIHGIRVLKGIEANIIDYKGSLDLEEPALKELELVIASLHQVCIEPGSRKEHTYALRAVMENPLVHIIGHPGDSRYELDVPELVKASKETGVFLEINNASLLPTSFRTGGADNIRIILKECLRLDCPVVLGSDAHYSKAVGQLSSAAKLCSDIGFPDELIINYDSEKFLTSIQK